MHEALYNTLIFSLITLLTDQKFTKVTQPSVMSDEGVLHFVKRGSVLSRSTNFKLSIHRSTQTTIHSLLNDLTRYYSHLA